MSLWLCGFLASVFGDPSMSAGTILASHSGMERRTSRTDAANGLVGDAFPLPVDRDRDQYRHIRVLRWTFRHPENDDERVICELALTGEDREYELRVPSEWNPTGKSVEQFDDALTAFQRHAMIERTLLDEGWELDTFESERVTVH